MECTREIVIVSDYSKFNHPGTIQLTTWDRVGTFITDRMPPEEFLEVIKSYNINILHGNKI